MLDGYICPVIPTRRDGSPSLIEGRQKVTAARRFAGITPELVESVRRGDKVEGWLALSHPPGSLNAARLAVIDNKGKARVTVAKRFAGMTPEVVENVCTG